MLKNTLLLTMVLSFVYCSVRPTAPVSIKEITQVYNLPWYSGYLDVDNDTKHMHYFYFPSQNDAKLDPLLFWFNGGPGCSSLLGALYEHGPFLINDAFEIYMNNPFAWNKRANVVYIESPAQVGFSYMDTDPITWNDEIVAELNLQAVVDFFVVWPEFNDRSTYIAGQSYAGIYVPTLAYKVHQYNDNPTRGWPINLQGFAVGNGCTDRLQCEFQNDYPVFLMQLYRDLGIISSELYNIAEQTCKDQGTDLSDQCEQVVDYVRSYHTQIINMQDGINIYDAYRPCYQNEVDPSKRMSPKQMKRNVLRKRRFVGDQLSWAPPCVDSLGIDTLLLNQANRVALGIPDKALPYSMCNQDENFNYDRSITGSYWVYQKLVPLNKYKITIYSGDSDPAVPISYWINKLRNQMKLTTEQYWRPWFTSTSNGRQNSGNVWTLNNKFKLVTFKGIGHMAPQWNYEGGSKMINNLLHGAQL